MAPPAKKPPKTVLAVRLPPEEIATLASGAAHRKMKPSEWLRKIVEHQNAADRKAGKAK